MRVVNLVTEVSSNEFRLFFIKMRILDEGISFRGGGDFKV